MTVFPDPAVLSQLVLKQSGQVTEYKIEAN